MEKKIEEGNKLIAEFMDFDIEANCQWIEDEDDSKGRKIEVNGTVDDLKYHTSWDWLMPVIEKIEKEPKAKVQIFGAMCLIVHDGTVSNGVNADTKLEATWNAVVDYLTSKPLQP